MPPILQQELWKACQQVTQLCVQHLAALLFRCGRCSPCSQSRSPQKRDMRRCHGSEAEARASDVDMSQALSGTPLPSQWPGVELVRTSKMKTSLPWRREVKPTPP